MTTSKRPTDEKPARMAKRVRLAGRRRRRNAAKTTGDSASGDSATSGTCPAQKREGPSVDGAPAPKRARISSLLPSPTAVSLPPPRKPLPPHQLILAPMVGGSELAFRLLARRHGAQLCYTPMIRCEEYSKAGAGVNLLERHVDDCPVVAHFSGDDPERLLEVAKSAERCSGVVAIDLNLGCPQRSAQSGHFGAFLCDPVDRKLLLRIVSTLSRGLSVPFFCKIRLLDSTPETLQLARVIADTGVSALAVHTRRRHDRPRHWAQWDQFPLIRQAVGALPLVLNGDVFVPEDIPRAVAPSGIGTHAHNHRPKTNPVESLLQACL